MSRALPVFTAWGLFFSLLLSCQQYVLTAGASAVHWHGSLDFVVGPHSAPALGLRSVPHVIPDTDIHGWLGRECLSAWVWSYPSAGPTSMQLSQVFQWERRKPQMHCKPCSSSTVDIRWHKSIDSFAGDHVLM